jgi:ABC-type nitrate/sulfonate/bicarbonate transport system substrate-binding protein
MTIRKDGLTRRQYIAATGAVLTAGIGGMRLASAQAATIRQGYQTNMWGMPTYYLLRSGLLEKRGLKFEEFAVPSGNLTMQQMVARQVDLGTYAGPSLILGHDKGGMVGIAVVEYVGRTCALVVRKDLNVSKVEQLKGMKIANQAQRRGHQQGRLPGSAHERQRHGGGACLQDRRRHDQYRAL